MKRRNWIVAALLVVLSYGGASSALAQADDSHPIIGAWKLNHEKSSFDPGSGPRSQVRRFLETEDGYIISIRATEGGQGNPTFAMVRMKIDGQDYEVWTTPALGTFLQSGDRPTATAAFTAVDDRTLSLLQKNNGTAGPLSPNTWAVSADGNTLTVTTQGTNQSGTAVHNVEVYDRVSDGS